MMRLDIRPEARLDLLEIWHRIAADNLNAANRMIEKLEEAIRGLTRCPEWDTSAPTCAIPATDSGRYARM